ncbi:MAG: hypothetical protein WB819_12230 [Terriglobia bacterium]|jgi:hypothetical protein
MERTRPGSQVHANGEANTVAPGLLPEAIKRLTRESVTYITALVEMEVTR